MIERLWDQSLQKIHPDILQEVFQTPDRSADQHDQASLYRNALEEYQFSYTPPTKRPRLEPALILDEEDIRLPDLVLDEEAVSVQRPFLTQNLFEQPLPPVVVPKGSCLASYVDSDGERLLVLAGGRMMDSVKLCRWSKGQHPLQEVASVPSMSNIPGDIQQIRLQHSVIRTETQRIAIRFLFHCLIVDVSVCTTGTYTMEVHECLKLPHKLVDIDVGRYSGHVLLWDEVGDLLLWTGDSIRVLFKRRIPLQTVVRHPALDVRLGNNSITEAIPLSVICRGRFSSQRSTAITTENASIFSFDFRVTISPWCRFRVLIHQMAGTRYNPTSVAYSSSSSWAQRRDYWSRV
jgi:hypothetical protein